nr:hypothetical protein [Propionicimonas sp.]
MAVGAVVGDEQDRQDPAQYADRHVDEEQPAPGQPAQHHSAEHRAEDRAEGGGQAHRGHRPRPGLGRDTLHRQGLHQRKHDPAPDTLEDAEGDQGLGVPRARAQRGTEDEQAEREQPQPLAAEPVLRPAHEGDRDRQREQVAGAHPLDRRYRGIQPLGERMKPDRDDRRIHDRGDPTQDQRREQLAGRLRRWRSLRLCAFHPDLQ